MLAGRYVLHFLRALPRTGPLLLMMREIEKRTGKPAAFIETDLVDPRYFSHANVKNRLESYFQMVDQKRSGASLAAA